MNQNFTDIEKELTGLTATSNAIKERIGDLEGKVRRRFDSVDEQLLALRDQQKEILSTMSGIVDHVGNVIEAQGSHGAIVKRIFERLGGDGS